MGDSKYGESAGAVAGLHKTIQQELLDACRHSSSFAGAHMTRGSIDDGL